MRGERSYGRCDLMLTLFSCKSASRKNSIVLSSNMAALSRGCKPRIVQFSVLTHYLVSDSTHGKNSPEQISSKSINDNTFFR